MDRLPPYRTSGTEIGHDSCENQPADRGEMSTGTNGAFLETWYEQSLVRLRLETVEGLQVHDSVRYRDSAGHSLGWPWSTSVDEVRAAALFGVALLETAGSFSGLSGPWPLGRRPRMQKKRCRPAVRDALG